jgi:hypothetical protein
MKLETYFQLVPMSIVVELYLYSAIRLYMVCCLSYQPNDFHISPKHILGLDEIWREEFNVEVQNCERSYKY